MGLETLILERRQKKLYNVLNKSFIDLVRIICSP